MEEIDGDGAGDEAQGETSQQTLEQFWSKVTDDIRNVTSVGIRGLNPNV